MGLHHTAYTSCMSALQHLYTLIGLEDLPRCVQTPSALWDTETPILIQKCHPYTRI